MSALKLHDYQEVAVAHLHQHPRSALFLDMGLGKTAATLSALRSEDFPALVVAPKRVAEIVWPTEARKWRPGLKVSLAAGKPAERRAALEEHADVYVIGRDNLADVLSSPVTYRTLILDELSGFKTRNTARWKSAAQIISRMPDDGNVWGLTGTPSPNGLMDLWAQMYLLDGGERLGNRITHFRARYFTAGRQLASGVVTEWHLKPEADARIHERIEDICLSMETDGRIELPPVTFNTVEVPLPAGARRVYRDMKKDLVADLSMLGGEVHSATNAAVLSNKLSQVSAGFIYHDADPTDPELKPPGTYQPLHREKVAAVKEIVEATSSPIVVFYRYKPERAMLLEALGSVAQTLDSPDVLDRWDKGKVPVLLAHPASAGHGLNLQHGGHTAIWTTLPWSLEEWQQANKRLARQGQKHPVVIHILEAPRTIDSSIRAALTEKSTVQQALMDHLESPL